MFHYSFNVLPRVTNALPYALPYYNRQFLQYSTDDLFLCNIRCITVHVTIILLCKLVCFFDYGLVGTSTFYIYTTKFCRGLCFKKIISVATVSWRLLLQ